MGTVYRAYDTATQRDVAIKVPRGVFVQSDEARQRFAREAEAWLRLSAHPNIVSALDVVDDETTGYRPAIVTEYCPGGTVAALLAARGAELSLPEALRIALQVCWAMEFAHGQGHVHRDLKPANVLLSAAGAAQVADFGLVKFLAEEASTAGESATDSEATPCLPAGNRRHRAAEEPAG